MQVRQPRRNVAKIEYEQYYIILFIEIEVSEKSRLVRRKMRARVALAAGCLSVVRKKGVLWSGAEGQRAGAKTGGAGVVPRGQNKNKANKKTTVVCWRRWPVGASTCHAEESSTMPSNPPYTDPLAARANPAQQSKVKQIDHNNGARVRLSVTQAAWLKSCILWLDAAAPNS